MPELMTLSEKNEWIEKKRTFLEKQRHSIRDTFQMGKQAWDEYHAFIEAKVDPNDFASEKDFDVEKAANRLNDYERDLLQECLEEKGRYFELVEPEEGIVYLALKTKMGIFKKYKDLEYIEGYSTLIRKQQVEKIKGTPNQFSPSWRGKAVLKRAIELQDKEVEELEGMKGIGSFYDFSSVL